MPFLIIYVIFNASYSFLRLTTFKDGRYRFYFYKQRDKCMYCLTRYYYDIYSIIISDRTVTK